jgi:predicted ATP-binding protein involved in virulence
MFLRSIELTNFRCFEERSWRFRSQFNVLIGLNGEGKTALLDASAIAIGSLTLGIDGVPSVGIKPDDVRRIRYRENALSSEEVRLPTRVSCDLSLPPNRAGVKGGDLRFARTLEKLRGKTDRREAKNIASYGTYLQEAVRSNAPVVLPLLAYYGTGRVWLQKREKSAQKPGSRFRGYEDAFAPAANHKLLSAWMRKAQMVALQRNEQIPELVAVQKAVANCLPGCAEVFFDIDDDEIVSVAKSGSVTPFHRLSDGYKNMLGTVADIAYRTAVLNPHLGANAVAQTDGVVLIDELDLHLHPSWQRNVVADLKRTFPRIQFVVTTHSPFIIQSLHADELIPLSGERPGPYVDRGIEEIAEEVMGVETPHRSAVYLEKEKAAEDYVAILREGADTKDPTVRARLFGLAKNFSDDPSFGALLQLANDGQASKK